MAKKRGYHHPDLRKTLLDSAARLIKNEGMRGFSLRKLAAEAGVSHAAPYRHFKSKEMILANLMLEGHKRLRTSLLAAKEEGIGTAADRLNSLGRAYLKFAQQNVEYLTVMFSREGMAAVMSVGEKLEFRKEDFDAFSVLEETIKACQAEGSLDPHMDSTVLSMHSWAEVHGLAILRNEGMIEGQARMHGQTEHAMLEGIFTSIRTRSVRKK